MPDKNKREAEIDNIIDKLRELWKLYPEQRLGQLIENYVIPSGKHRGPMTCWIYYASDDKSKTNIDISIEEIKRVRRTR